MSPRKLRFLKLEIKEKTKSLGSWKLLRKQLEYWSKSLSCHIPSGTYNMLTHEDLLLVL